MHEQAVKLQAPGNQRLYLWFEPWAQGLAFPAGTVIELRAVSPESGQLDIDVSSERTAIYGWAGCTLSVIIADNVIHSFEQAVPEGLTRHSVSMLFGNPPTPTAEEKNHNRKRADPKTKSPEIVKERLGVIALIIAGLEGFFFYSNGAKWSFPLVAFAILAFFVQVLIVYAIFEKKTVYLRLIRLVVIAFLIGWVALMGITYSNILYAAVGYLGMETMIMWLKYEDMRESRRAEKAR